MKKELPKAYEPKKYEDEIYEKWEKSGMFNPDSLDVDEKAESYSIVMPPPNVTGTLHLGHAEMLVVEDILIRYHRMLGHRTLWTPGTDHAAIATQTKVEKILKEEGTDRHKLGRKKFLDRVEKYAEESHDTIVGQVKKMGSSCDWSREAYTLDETRHKAVYSVFKMMYDDGLIYRGERIVNWCPRCHSTLADDEVEYIEENGKLYWIKYGPFTLATARPETKLGDTAVAVHPDDERYKDMVEKEYDIPGVLGEFKIKVVADKSVDPEFGSGAIKVTPAHSLVDNEIAQRHDLPSKKIIDEDGKMMENCEKYAGLTTKEARKKIVADMKKMGLIDHIDENYSHNIAVCYRCDTPIEPLPSEQWFIDVNKPLPKKKLSFLGNLASKDSKTIKEICLEVVREGKIKIIPERFEKQYFHWMENLRDWCISRQIWYGHQIPVWYKNDEAYVGVKAPREDGWTQDPDTLDTWFSSGLWTFSTLANKLDQIRIEDGKLVIDSKDYSQYHPTDVLETGYDILFFWVARMIIMTTYAVGDLPFKDVYLHGLVLDEHGKKMSKSKGNVINPLDMCEKYGTDATRLSLVVGAAPGKDFRLSEEKIAGFRNFSNKLWNISRYILENGRKNAEVSPRVLAVKPQVKFQKLSDKLTLADRWILKRIHELIHELNIDLNKYQFSAAGEKLRDFTWNDLADWYLEVSKFEENKETKAAILNMILKDLLKLWHPFIPFVTEKIWEEMGEEKMLLVSNWPKYSERRSAFTTNDTTDFKTVQKIIIVIRNARAQYHIEPKQKIDVVIYTGKNVELIKSQENIIRNLRTGIENLKIEEKGEKLPKSFSDSVNGIEIHIPLKDVIDIDKEKARLEKEIQAAEKYSASLEKKFKNKSFVDKAPKKIVDQEKEKLAEKNDQIEKLKSYLDGLST